MGLMAIGFHESGEHPEDIEEVNIVLVGSSLDSAYYPKGALSALVFSSQKYCREFWSML